MKLRFLLALPLALIACEDQPAPAPGSTTPRYERVESDPSLFDEATQPVRIGALGPSFAACNSTGTTRRLVAESGDRLVVRAAPFQSAHEVARLPAGATFFICSRSLDQKWFGIVFEGEGNAAPACGVTAPVPSRRDYAGACHSGWIASVYVKVTAGTAPAPAPGAEGTNPSNSSES